MLGYCGPLVGSLMSFLSWYLVIGNAAKVSSLHLFPFSEWSNLSFDMRKIGLGNKWGIGLDVVLLPTIGGHWALMWTVDRSHLLPRGYSVCTGPWLRRAPGKGAMDLGKCFSGGGKKTPRQASFIKFDKRFLNITTLSPPRSLLEQINELCKLINCCAGSSAFRRLADICFYHRGTDPLLQRS